MKTHHLRLFCVGILLLVALNAFGQTMDEWLPCTNAELQLAPDSTLDSRDAVIIFHKNVVKDEYLGPTTRSTYIRIKVFTQEGTKHADVAVPFVSKRTKIKEMSARVIAPDGKITEIASEKIHEEKLVETEEGSISQKTFSIPGVVPGAVIDYRYTVETKPASAVTVVQEEIPILRYELSWYPLDDPNRIGNSVWLNLPAGVKPQMVNRPATGQPEEVNFTVDRIPAFKPEPFMPPKRTVVTRLVCYYGTKIDPLRYWIRQSSQFSMIADLICSNLDPVRNISDTLAAGAPLAQRLKAAYEWVQREFRNTSIEDSTGEMEQEVADDLEELFDRRSGSEFELNLALIALLRAMDFKAELCFAVDNRYNRFFSSLKYWQFDEILVRVVTKEGGVFHLRPADPFLPFGMAPWYVEGTETLLASKDLGGWSSIPPSPVTSNEQSRLLTISIVDSLDFSGRFSEKITGQRAAQMKRALFTKSSSARTEYLKSHLERALPGAEVDSISDHPGAGSGDPLLISCTLTAETIIPPGGENRILFRPFTHLETESNPFFDDKRVHPVSMDYGRVEKDEVRLPVPAGWTVQMPIEEDLIGGKLGFGIVQGKLAGDTLVVSRSFTLKKGFWESVDYNEGKSLFRRLEATKDFTVVLTKKKRT